MVLSCIKPFLLHMQIITVFCFLWIVAPFFLYINIKIFPSPRKPKTTQELSISIDFITFLYIKGWFCCEKTFPFIHVFCWWFFCLFATFAYRTGWFCRASNLPFYIACFFIFHWNCPFTYSNQCFCIETVLLHMQINVFLFHIYNFFIYKRVVLLRKNLSFYICFFLYIFFWLWYKKGLFFSHRNCPFTNELFIFFDCFFLYMNLSFLHIPFFLHMQIHAMCLTFAYKKGWFLQNFAKL